MDANGKLSVANIDVAGAFSATSGAFGSQTIQTTGAPGVTLRRTENDTTEREIASYQLGSGTSAKGSLRVVGGGANDVQTMRFYVNDVLTFQWTGALFTHSVDTLFGAFGIRADTDGYFDITEISAPSAPSSNVARAYARDDGSGTTRLYFKDSAGRESRFQPAADRQIFTGSGTWTKPTEGQTTALIEMWGGGGSGALFDIDGPGGGGAYSRKIIALASLSASVTVTVGSGGTVPGSGLGNPGGTTTFGSYLSAFGGGGGGASNSTNGDGGGGGGLTSAGATGNGSTGGAGGTPRGVHGSDTWGAVLNANPFGGAGGDSSSGVGQHAFLGGGSGGGSVVFGDSIGGSSIFGGGGGAADSGFGSSTGGTSIYGGNGGANAVAGTAPGGGGGRRAAGARGEVRITCW